jgi:hypothetical protein
MPDAVPAPGTARMRDEVERTVRLLSVPDGVVELRAIAENGTHSGYFSDPALLASSTELLDLATVQGAYITLNEVDPALLARRANRVKMRLGAKDATTSDADILRRRWFPIDIDPVRPSGVSSTDDERDLAFRKAGEIAGWLLGHGFPEPVRGDSGNGAHLLYRIDLPNDEESKRLVQQCLSVASLFFSDERCTVDTAVYNAGRIWKLYGTVSRKGDHTSDRPHRRSHLLAVPDPIERVPKEVLETLAGLLSPDPDDPGSCAGFPPGGTVPGTPGSNPSESPGANPAGAPRNGHPRPDSNQRPFFHPGSSPGDMVTGTPGPHRMKVYQDGIVPLNLPGWLREHGLVVRYEKPWQGGRLFVLDECPFSTAHRDGAFAIQFPNGAVYAGCKHASCGGGKQRWLELRRMHDPGFVEREKERELSELSGQDPDANGTTSGVESPAEKPGGNPAARTSGAASTKGPGGTSPPAPAGNGDRHDAAARERAKEILRSGDPRAFILDTFAKCHVGDGVVAACYLVSTLSSSVANSRGLHVCPTGDSGKGKSDSANAFLRLLPDSAKVQGSITSKALFYHSVEPATVIIFDDFAMGEDLREVLKNSTSRFQHQLEHYTLNANRQPVVLSLPPRCVWWILSVDNPGDDQVLNRMMNPWIDDSEQQDRRVRDHIFALARRSGGAPGEDRDVAVCREIFSLVREQRYTVRIPFADRIHMDSFRNRRNPIMLLDIIRSFAVLRFMQRECRSLPDGNVEIDAAEEDFNDAARLFSALDSTEGGQTSKLLKNEKLLIDSIIAMKAEEFTIKEAQAWMGLPHNVVRRILHGRPERDNDTGGLLAKCPAFGVVETTISEGTIAAITRRRENHYIFDYERYTAWNRSNGVWLSPEDQDPGREDGPDPKNPTWDQVGISTGIRSDSRENIQIGDRAENTHNNSTMRSSRSQHGESAACLETSEISQPGGSLPEVCSRDLGSWDHENGNISENERNEKLLLENENLVIPDLIPNDSAVGSWDHVRERDYAALPIASEKPCHVCGSSPTSSVKIRQLTDPPGTGDQYLCYDCLKRAKAREKASKRSSSEPKAGPVTSGAIPIPGILETRDFTRVKFSQGKCDICGGNEAVYRSASKNTNCCEKCYGRLVREGNRAEGVG